MGFIDKIKGAAKYVKDKVVSTFMPQDDDDTPPPAVDTSQYLHVSMPLVPIDNPLLRKLLGRDYEMVTPGMTRNVGNNVMKMAADALGKNNKERRRLRTKIKRRAAELRTVGIA